MHGRFKMEYRLFTIVRYNYRDYNKHKYYSTNIKYIYYYRYYGVQLVFKRYTDANVHASTI